MKKRDGGNSRQIEFEQSYIEDNMYMSLFKYGSGQSVTFKIKDMKKIFASNLAESTTYSFQNPLVLENDIVSLSLSENFSLDESNQLILSSSILEALMFYEGNVVNVDLNSVDYLSFGIWDITAIQSTQLINAPEIEENKPGVFVSCVDKTASYGLQIYTSFDNFWFRSVSKNNSSTIDYGDWIGVADKSIALEAGSGIEITDNNINILINKEQLSLNNNNEVQIKTDFLENFVSNVTPVAIANNEYSLTDALIKKYILNNELDIKLEATNDIVVYKVSNSDDLKAALLKVGLKKIVLEKDIEYFEDINISSDTILDLNNFKLSLPLTSNIFTIEPRSVLLNGVVYNSRSKNIYFKTASAFNVLFLGDLNSPLGTPSTPHYLVGCEDSKFINCSFVGLYDGFSSLVVQERYFIHPNTFHNCLFFNASNVEIQAGLLVNHISTEKKATIVHNCKFIGNMKYAVNDFRSNSTYSKISRLIFMNNTADTINGLVCFNEIVDTVGYNSAYIVDNIRRIIEKEELDNFQLDRISDYISNVSDYLNNINKSNTNYGAIYVHPKDIANQINLSNLIYGNNIDKTSIAITDADVVDTNILKDKVASWQVTIDKDAKYSYTDFVTTLPENIERVQKVSIDPLDTTVLDDNGLPVYSEQNGYKNFSEVSYNGVIHIKTGEIEGVPQFIEKPDVYDDKEGVEAVLSTLTVGDIIIVLNPANILQKNTKKPATPYITAFVGIFSEGSENVAYVISQEVDTIQANTVVLNNNQNLQDYINSMNTQSGNGSSQVSVESKFPVAQTENTSVPFIFLENDSRSWNDLDLDIVYENDNYKGILLPKGVIYNVYYRVYVDTFTGTDQANVSLVWIDASTEETTDTHSIQLLDTNNSNNYFIVDYTFRIDTSSSLTNQILKMIIKNPSTEGSMEILPISYINIKQVNTPVRNKQILKNIEILANQEKTIEHNLLNPVSISFFDALTGQGIAHASIHYRLQNSNEIVIYSTISLTIDILVIV